MTNSKEACLVNHGYKQMIGYDAIMKNNLFKHFGPQFPHI